MYEDSNKRVEFNDDYIPRSYHDYEEPSKLIKIVIKYSSGLIKNGSQAEIFLTFFSIIIIIISIFVAFHKHNNNVIRPGEKVEVIPRM